MLRATAAFSLERGRRAKPLFPALACSLTPCCLRVPPFPPFPHRPQEYLDEHKLSKLVEKVVNATVKDKPEVPVAYMVRRRQGTNLRGRENEGDTRQPEAPRAAGGSRSAFAAEYRPRGPEGDAAIPLSGREGMEGTWST